VNPVLQFKRLHPAAKIPTYQSDHAAGMDLCACPHDGQPLTMQPGDIRLIPCGFAMAIPHGFEGQVRPRSGLATKHGISMPNTPGTVDSDYRGEMMVPLINLGRQAFVVEAGMRVAQLVIAPVARARIVEVETLDDTSRGSGGFGSTGVHS
jgi:dUTP pyrophosphatase